MPEPTKDEEVRAALDAAECDDPVAHGYGPIAIEDALELLDAAAAKVELHVQSERATDRVVRVARRIVRSEVLNDEQAFRRAFSLAKLAIERAIP